MISFIDRWQERIYLYLDESLSYINLGVDKKKKKNSYEVWSYKLLTSLTWRLWLIRSNQFINLEILVPLKQHI